MNMHILTLALLATIALNCKVKAQDISSHKWKDRVILILSDNESDDRLLKQIDIFRSDAAGLKDRKLVVYTVKGNAYRKGINSDQWVSGSEPFKEFGDSGDHFRVLLMGLDGGIKIDQNEVISLDNLFSTIDAMPMRRNELRARNQ